jgi:trehalose synthase
VRNDVLDSVNVGNRRLSAYQGVAPDSLLEKLNEVAGSLSDLRLLYLNATPYGGGVAELLRSIVPLLNDLGLHVDWKIIKADDEFFEITKSIHNGLQGSPVELSSDARNVYEATSRKNAELMDGEYDVIVVHDPQPAGVRRHFQTRDTRWIWRCHIDTMDPDPAVLEFVREYLHGYDAAVFTLDEFIPPDLPVPKSVSIPPAIDPMSPKNGELPTELARQVLDWIGVRLDRPLITQVARFDPWKDPLGVIETYHVVRERFPTLQLALVGSMALDDPEGWHIYDQVQTKVGRDELVYVFSNLDGIGNVEVNAFQRLSGVVVQKSLREGFGLVVSEAMWKQTPVVAARTGGIPLQMPEGIGGHLVEPDDVEGCAAAIIGLLENPYEGARLGAVGRERVREHFLLPRLLLDELTLLRELTSEPAPAKSSQIRNPLAETA